MFTHSIRLMRPYYVQACVGSEGTAVNRQSPCPQEPTSGVGRQEGTGKQRTNNTARWRGAGKKVQQRDVTEPGSGSGSGSDNLELRG